MSPSISAHDLAEQLHTQRIAVIDVREPMEYASGHIAGSLNVPLSLLHQADLPQGPLVLQGLQGKEDTSRFTHMAGGPSLPEAPRPLTAVARRLSLRFGYGRKPSSLMHLWSSPR